MGENIHPLVKEKKCGRPLRHGLTQTDTEERRK
jgi:hypothetical protein